MNPVYRWKYVGTQGYMVAFMPKWVERREIPGNTVCYEYRDEQTGTWCNFALPKKTFSESLSYWNSEPDWQFDLSICLPAAKHNNLPQDVIDQLLPTSINKKHKCHCYMITLIREGCRCNGI